MKKITSVIPFFLSIVSTILLFQGCFQASPENTFDLIIKGGRVYDGTSARPRVTDIGIKGDKIAAIGDFSGLAAKTIDASGLIVTPGFIDVHSQTDLILQEKGIWRVIAYIKPGINGNHNYLYQGVTTIITGNNGRGYTNTAKWLGWVDSLKFGTNVYHLAPAGAIRQELFGDKEAKLLDEKQRNILKKRLTREMENGAVGVSFDLSALPDRMFTREELTDIARSIKPYGGIISINLRASAGGTDTTGNPALISSLKEIVEIGRLSQTPLEISSLQLMAPWGNFDYDRFDSVIRNAREAGIDITADQTPYDAEVDLLTHFLPSEYVVDYKIKKEYTTAEGKTKLIKAIDKLFTSLSPEKFLLVSYPGNKSYAGKTIRQIAAAEGKDPVRCYWEMAIAASPPTVAVAASDDRFAKKIMRSSLVLTASEGISHIQDKPSPHPGYWGTFPRKLRKYVLEDNIIPLADALRSMTALPAEKFNLRNRGRISVGYFADIAVIDLKKIRDKATFIQPAQYAEGVEYLIVNGVVSIEKGEVTGKKGGRALKRI